MRVALCFGWIDGQGRSIDDDRHMQRFTPRKSRRWSAVNVALVAELEAEGRMTEAGRAAFTARRTQERGAVLDVDSAQSAAARVRRAPAPRPPEGGRLVGLHAAELPQVRAFWISEAKRPQPRERRFGLLVEACAAGEQAPVVGRS